MPDIATVLKAEISRIARKEVRAELTSLKKAVGTSRSEIAALKRRVLTQEQELRRIGKAKAAPKTATEEADEKALQRFSAKGFASLRRKLGLSAAEFGLLLGASGKSIYKWEEGSSRPRAKYLPAIAHLRSLGKRQVMTALESLREVA